MNAMFTFSNMKNKHITIEFPGKYSFEKEDGEMGVDLEKAADDAIKEGHERIFDFTGTFIGNVINTIGSKNKGYTITIE
jgi:hypothetical protein